MDFIYRPKKHLKLLFLRTFFRVKKIFSSVVFMRERILPCRYDIFLRFFCKSGNFVLMSSPETVDYIMRRTNFRQKSLFRTSSCVSYDYIVDAIDLVSCKLDLIETALARGIPILSAMGTGNKLDPSQFRVADISKTEGCPLARVIRKELKRRGILHHKVVFSPELPAEAEQREAPPPGRRSIPASAPWVPPVAGFLLAGTVIRDLTQV